MLQTMTPMTIMIIQLKIWWFIDQNTAPELYMQLHNKRPLNEYGWIFGYINLNNLYYITHTKIVP